MVESRGDSIENFANDLVNKLVLESMDILDANYEDADNYWHRFHVNCAIPGCAKCKDRKNRAQQGRQRVEKSLSCQGDQDRSSELTGFPVWARDANIPFDVDQRASEEIRKIVQGLQGVQIGDSSFVGPVLQVTSLEIQVKRAVQEMSNISEMLNINEVPITEGQGDVHIQVFEETMPTAVAEVNNRIENSSPERLEMVEKYNNENETQMQRQVQLRLQEQQQEVSKLRSTCFLHRIIKELEDAEANQENVLKVSKSINAVSQERIAAWEESEEKFIRMIEGSKEESLEDETDDSFAISVVEEVPAIVKVEIQEINSRPASPTPPEPLSPAAINSSQSLGVKRESILLQQRETKLEKSKMKNKMCLGEKLRRFFRSPFKRRKDC